MLPGATGRGQAAQTHLQVEAAATMAWGVACGCWLGSRWAHGLAMQRSTEIIAAERDRITAAWSAPSRDEPSLVFRLIADAPLVLGRRERRLTPCSSRRAGWGCGSVGSSGNFSRAPGAEGLLKT